MQMILVTTTTTTAQATGTRVCMGQEHGMMVTGPIGQLAPGGDFQPSLQAAKNPWLQLITT